MKELFNSRYILFFFAVFTASCDGQASPLALPSQTPPPVMHVNRGAARQMYGSGQLRPPGQIPLVHQLYNSTNGPQNIRNASQQNQQRRMPMPMPIPGLFAHDIGRMPDGYPGAPHIIPGGRSRSGAIGGIRPNGR